MKKVGIIGRVNVGKSTLFNRLIGERKSVVSDIAGTTRDSLSAIVEHRGKEFELIDFGGVNTDTKDSVEKEVQTRVWDMIGSLDLILFVVERGVDVSAEDSVIASLLRKQKAPKIVVVNKVDVRDHEDQLSSFYRLGFKKVIPISSVHNRNIDELLDSIMELIEVEPLDEDMQSSREASITKVAIVGRPNAGKSSLFNSLYGEEKNIVSEIAGTTRDAIDTIVKIGDQNYLFIDTAGLKRRSQLSNILDFFASSRALQSIKNADIVLYIIDYESGVVSYDLSLLSHILEHGKSIIVVVNKWDLREKDSQKQQYRDWLMVDNSIFKKMPIVFTSATKKHGIDDLAKEIADMKNRLNIKIPTPKLNRVIRSMSERIPSGRGKVLYATQVSSAPFELMIFVNNPEFFNKSSIGYIEDYLRKNFDLDGVVMKMTIRKSS